MAAMLVPCKMAAATHILINISNAKCENFWPLAQAGCGQSVHALRYMQQASETALPKTG